VVIFIVSQLFLSSLVIWCKGDKMKKREQSEQRRKVVVVGAGSVGATYCYALAQSGLADEIVLIDRNQELDSLSMSAAVLKEAIGSISEMV
jgi:tRNA A37 threonylcarbamoyladenosine dehydratase